MEEIFSENLLPSGISNLALYVSLISFGLTDPPPQEIVKPSLGQGGGGSMDVFWNSTMIMTDRQTDTFHFMSWTACFISAKGLIRDLSAWQTHWESHPFGNKMMTAISPYITQGFKTAQIHK